MKKYFVFVVFLLAFREAQATDKIWMPLGTPQVTAVTTPSKSPTLTTLSPSAQPSMTPVALVPGDDHWISRYPDGTTESEGDHVGGKKDGIWKYYRPDGTECREVEFKDGAMTGGLVLWSPDGQQKYFGHFTDLIDKVTPGHFTVTALLPYLMDLAGNGKDEIVLLARSDGDSLLMVLTQDGDLLDSKQTNGNADDLIFGTVKKGGPVCFGYDAGCDPNFGSCNWEFDIWDGQKIKTVLQYNGWYGKSGPFTLPVFKVVDGLIEIVTDNGTFKWNEAAGEFKIAK
jgi:hypothetical protein